MKSFIALNKKVLKQFSGGDMIHTAHVSNMESSAGFMTATVKAGVALALREVRTLMLIFVVKSLREERVVTFF